MQPTPITPPIGINTVPVQADAKNRAWRTFVQQIGIDIAIALIPFITDLVGATDSWNTKEYWITLGTSVLKTIVAVIIAYIYRLKKDPVGARGAAVAGEADRRNY